MVVAETDAWLALERSHGKAGLCAFLTNPKCETRMKAQSSGTSLATTVRQAQCRTAGRRWHPSGGAGLRDETERVGM